MLTAHTYNKGVAIVPSLTANFADGLTKAIYVGGAGTVPVVFPDGDVATFTCIAGQVLEVAAKRVNTGGSATLLIALYQV